MTSDPYPEGRLQKSEFGNLLPDVLRQIVRPVLADLIAKHEDITNKSSLHSAFKKETGSTVSFSTFNMWLEVLGISFRKNVVVVGLTQVPTPGGAGVGPRPDVGEPEVKVQFDNETPMDFNRPRGYGDAFGEMARNSGGFQ
jgi:hypothetical protein